MDFLLDPVLAEASGSLINNANLISKVYFPRLLVPAATFAVAFAVDFVISFRLLIVLMAWFCILYPGWQILALPMFVALGFLNQLGPISLDHRT